jgi:predicted amidohydrolase
MHGLNIDLWTCDIGAAAESPTVYAELLVSCVEQSWDEGADLVAFPEFSWMGLERFVSGNDPLRKVAELFWNELWPSVALRLNRPDKAVVMGTAPFLHESGEIRNRAPILAAGQFLHQDKIHLTPWESAFSPGRTLRLWSFNGLRIAVIICLDIEIPELSASLRASDMDLLIVPSATESLMGVERIGRCASARAVELGCHVALCHLVGLAESELVDKNVGRLGFFRPSQSMFADGERETESSLWEEGFHRASYHLDGARIQRMRKRRAETNPALVSPRSFRIER